VPAARCHAGHSFRTKGSRELIVLNKMKEIRKKTEGKLNKNFEVILAMVIKSFLTPFSGLNSQRTVDLVGMPRY